MAQCPNLSKNQARCSCTYTSCDKQALCCDCLHYHLRMQQLPGCCFPKDAEATYDRSFKNFVRVYRHLLD